MTSAGTESTLHDEWTDGGIRELKYGGMKCEGAKKKSESGSDRSRDDMMWGLNTPGNGEMRGETMGGHMNI